MGNGKHDRQTIIAAVIALAALAVAFAYGAVVSGHVDANSTPLITAVLGFLAPVVLGLLALLRVEKVDKRLDGALEQLVEQKVDEVTHTSAPPEREPEGQSPSSSSSSR